MFLAHSINEDGHEHILKDHLLAVAEIAQELCRTDMQKMLAKYTALLHDAGKFQQRFQDYLKHGGRRGSVPHAALGAVLARKYSPSILPFCIEGHHKGLADKADLKMILMEYEKEEAFPEIEKAFTMDMQNLLAYGQELDKIVIEKYSGKEFELFIRYLFSILTDADWLDTEHHFNPDASIARRKYELDIDRLISIMENHFLSLPRDGEINRMRNEVREFAVSKADKSVGFFSLNLPTGLGKTLTSFYWALRHSKVNALRRIIIVLPYINIIDQTAQILKDIFGDEWVLEHHSGITEQELYDDDKKEYDNKKLACENWDYPIIVTTTVQFFESLFSNKPSQCRKIHNIADSVVIFDEVQTLPKHLVQPTLTMLKNVSSVFHTTFIFCTATQPAFSKREGFDGIEQIEPLVASPAAIFANTRRVEYFLIENLNPIDNDLLLETVCSSKQAVLIIFNTKRETAHFFSILRNDAVFEQIYHLSTSMCAHHRRSIIKCIRADLAENKKIAVCSTQLIEAGVDFDFPVVFRALSPLEAIIQAAGRCNREGKMAGHGNVYIFQLENSGMPDKLYGTMAQYAKSIILDNLDRLHQHDAFETYYHQVVSLFVDPDKHKIEQARKVYQFKTIAESYKLIESRTMPLFLQNYNKDSQAIYEAVRYKPLSRIDFRNMQPFLVQVYPNFAMKFQHLISKTDNGISLWFGLYDHNTGIVGDDLQVDQFIV